MLDLLVDLGWKSALIAGLALLANPLLRRRPAGERVALLRAALAALLLLPLLALAGPELEFAVLPAIEAAPGAALALSNSGGAESVAAAPATPFEWMLALYLTGAGLLLLRLVVGLGTLWRWTRTATPARDPRWIAAMAAARLRRPVRLLVSPAVAAPMSWGLLPAWVLIGPGTERHVEQAEAVVAHELAHVRRFDWPVLIAARLAVLCFWFNPLVWLLARELARQTEHAADAEAIGHVARADYAQTLLMLAGGAAHPAACGMSITGSALGRRICCVLDGGAARPASRLACLMLLLGIPLAAAPLAAMQLVPATTPIPVTTAQPSRPAAVIALPPIIPAAQAAEAPVLASPRFAVRRPEAPRAARPAPVAARPDKPIAPRAPTLDLQLHAGHATPPPPAPPAPGSEAAAWQAALAGEDKPPVRPRGRAVTPRGVPPTTSTDRDDARIVAGGMQEAAKGLRLRAQDLERVAADGDVAPEIRGAHARAAGALRNQAEKLDLQARRKLSGT